MENIQFENSYEVTPRLMKKWNSLSFKRIGRHRHWVSLAAKIVFAALAVLCLVMGSKYNMGTIVALAGVFGAGILLMIFMPGFANRKRYKNYLKISGQNKWLQTLRFGEKLEVASGNSVTTYELGQINYIDENKDCVILWINNALLLMVYKNAFTIGNADDFRLYLYARLGDGGILWTKKQMNRYGFKRQLPRIVLLIVLAIGVPLSIFISPAGIYNPSYHTNKDGTVERNYQKDFETIYFCHWAVFRTQEDTTAYKIDIKNNAFYYIGNNAALSKDDWGTEQGDADFRFIVDLEDTAIDSFFRQTARHGFTQWEERYENKNILDGSEWYVKIIFSDGTIKESSGRNKYPATWDAVIRDFENLTGYQFE